MPKTCTMCNSEPVLSASSAAVRAARSASLEPSVAKRTLVGKMLIWCPPRWTLALRLHDASRNYPVRTSRNSTSRDCLESRRRVLDRLCLALQEGEMGHFHPLLATRYTPNRGLLRLSRQSLYVLG